MRGEGAPFMELDEICRLEAELTDSIWIVATEEGFQDLDSDALQEAVQANLKRGIEYRLILPDDAKVSWLKGIEDSLLSQYRVQTVPRQLFNFACQFQINDPEKRHRRGFYIVRFGSDYFGIEMDSDVLRNKIAAFRYMWNMPATIRQAVHHAKEPSAVAPAFLVDDFAEASECMALGQNRAAVILFARCLERLLLEHVATCGLSVEPTAGLGRLIGEVRGAAKQGQTFLSDGAALDSLLATFGAINRFRIENVHAKEKMLPPDAHTTEMIHRGMLVIFDAYSHWDRDDAQGEAAEKGQERV